MPILNIKTVDTGHAGIYPRIIYIDTTDSMATVRVTGFLNNARDLGSDFTNKDMALTYTTDGIAWLEVQIVGANCSLVQSVEPGDIYMTKAGVETVTGAKTFEAGTLILDGSTSEALVTNASGEVVGVTAVNSAVYKTTELGIPGWTASLTNGQVVIGSTGSSPVPATLTAGTGMSITNAAGSITLNATGGGYAWTEVTGTTQAMAANNGYVANNVALVTLTIPVTGSIGDTFLIQGSGAGLYAIAQNAGQTIHFGSSDTTTGVGGSLTATNRYDSIEIVCITIDTEWAVLTGTQGVYTVV